MQEMAFHLLKGDLLHAKRMPFKNPPEASGKCKQKLFGL